VVGILIWYFFLKSGLHPTIAGIMVAFTVPITSRIRAKDFVEEVDNGLVVFKEFEDDPSDHLLSYEQLSSVDSISDAAKHVQPPLQKLEHDLHGFVAYLVLPIFALANAGVALGGAGDALSSALTLNIALALLVGKGVGVSLLSWFSVKLGWASLPEGTSWIQLIALGLLGGVGFTMALFISNLAFIDAELLNEAKMGILIGSTLAGLGGYLLLRFTLPAVPDPIANEPMLE
ncbi:MAG: Na+/H+ antiporter NhaA, partial [Bacteroidetes bacterium]|nr:Na+/H+ antiporter NhaA [Bacteroidota bacterium]